MPARLSKVPQPRSVDELLCGLCRKSCSHCHIPEGDWEGARKQLYPWRERTLPSCVQSTTGHLSLGCTAAPGLPWKVPAETPLSHSEERTPSQWAVPPRQRGPRPATLCRFSSTRKDFSLGGLSFAVGYSLHRGPLSQWPMASVDVELYIF